MTQSFVPNADNQGKSVANQDHPEKSHREPLKHMLIGSPKAVTITIQHLQIIGYAEVGAWSPLIPTANQGEVMSLLNRSIVVR